MSCRLGRVAEAWAWLEKACKADESGRFEEMALSDFDLKPLRPRSQHEHLLEGMIEMPLSRDVQADTFNQACFVPL